MLERAPSCLEPASQLFLRGIEPPLRTHRVLGPSFWRNGGNELAVPSWWPLYLAKVRGSSQDPRLGRRPEGHGTLPVAEQAERCRLVRPQASEHDFPTCQPYTRVLRQYTSQARQEKIGAGDNAHNVEVTFPASTSASTKAYDTWSTPQHAVSEPPGRPSERTDIDIEEHLRSLLARHKVEKATQESDGGDHADAVWALFIQLSNQETYASSVFHFLAGSYASRRSKQTMWAFETIPVSQRSAADYDAAVRVALKMDDFRLCLSINTEATARKLNAQCSSFLLLHFTSNRLWGNAVKVWATSFQPLATSSHPLATGIGLFSQALARSLRSQGDNYKELPQAINQLAMQILTRSPIIMRISGTLALIGRELLTVILRSGKLMSSITPTGLLSILNKYKALQLLRPTMYLDAVDTLLKLAKRSDKSGLGTMLYRHLRLTFPDFRPSRALLGALLSIHAAEAAPREAYTFYLREFASSHGVADEKSYQSVLSALSTQGDVVGVKSVFEQLCQAHSLPKTLDYYNPLIYVHARLGDAEGAQRQFEKLPEWGMVADTYSWNILIYAHARSTRPEGAFKVYEKMKAAGVRPDKYTFGTLMSMSSSVGDTDAVLSVIDQAQQSQVEGSYEMMSGLIQSYLRNNQADTAERLAEATSQAKFQGSPVKMWNYLLRHYAFRKDSDAVLRVQQRMHDLGIQPDDMTYAALMTALVVIGKTKDAMRILRRLNLNQTLVATPFHYAIVLHGYALERNRDMGSVVYQEMAERFPDIGASPQLAMLHLQSRRSLKSNGAPASVTADWLAQILFSITAADRATKQPQPGFRRRGALHSVPSIYLEHLVNIVLSKGRVALASTLIRRYESLTGTSFLHLDSTALESLQWLAVRMRMASLTADWKAVDDVWRRILQQAMHIATPLSAKLAKQHDATKVIQHTNLDNGKVEDLSAPRLPSIGIELPFTEPDFRFDSMIKQSPSQGSLLDRPNMKILPAQRFVLAPVINQYLRALDLQQLHANAIELIPQLERAGFMLTSRNWNFYIQTLTRSSERIHWVEAFRIFEEKMLPNTPSWRVLRRGRWQSSDAEEGTKTFRRSDVEKTDPELLVPTYTTALHLAFVLKKSVPMALRENRTFVARIAKVARGTYRFVRAIPRIKDRMQGVLLRERYVIGDFPKRPRNYPNPDRSGVLGSRSPLDHITPDEIESVDGIVHGKSMATNKHNQDPSAMRRRTDDMKQIEHLEGQIDRSPVMVEKYNRLEDDNEVQRRVQREEGSLFKRIDLMRRDQHRPRTVSDEWFGHPGARSEANIARPARKLRSGALYDPNFVDLEREALAQRQLHERLDSSLQKRAHRKEGARVIPEIFRKVQGTVRDETLSNIARRLKDTPRSSANPLEDPAYLPEKLLQVNKLRESDPIVKEDRKQAVKRRVEDSYRNAQSRASKDKDTTDRTSPGERRT
ncbi:minichromosome maintenance protein 3 [Exophiala viscosa]|uniref:minichromosome maintenance protein 3 n=1 Tax=Exophiala viscosa TaxID=2486360 RepID=UPI00219C8B04|nr:minichromosome maintenance protein 3 [Exophiala viscosa]